MTAALLRVYSGEHNTDCCFAVITLDQPQVKTIVERIEQAREARDRDMSFVELTWWDDAPTFLGWDETLEEACVLFQPPTTAEPTALCSDKAAGWGLFAAGYALSPTLVRRVECRQMVVSAGEVFWRAIVKHTSMRVETEAIPVEVFEGLLAAEPSSVPAGTTAVSLAPDRRLGDIVHFADALVAATITLGHDRLLAQPDACRWAVGLAQLERDEQEEQVQGYASLLAVLGETPGLVAGLVLQLAGALRENTVQHSVTT